MTPRRAKTEKQICKLPRNSVDTPDYWLLIHEDFVTLTAQRNAELPSRMLGLPRATFEAFIDWYNSGVWKRPRSGKARKLAGAK